MFRPRRWMQVPAWMGGVAFGLLLSLPMAAAEKPKKSAEPLDEFVVGRFTFLDSDPQGFYDLFVVRAAGGLSSVERIQFRPASGSCLNPARAEVAIGALPGTLPQLLENRDLCS